MAYKKGDIAYFITFFKRARRCKIVDVRIIRTNFYYGVFSTNYEYIIEFKNKTRRIVNEQRLF